MAAAEAGSPGLAALDVLSIMRTNLACGSDRRVAVVAGDQNPGPIQGILNRVSGKVVVIRM